MGRHDLEEVKIALRNVRPLPLFPAIHDHSRPTMYPYVLLLVFTTLSHCIASPLSPDLLDGQIVLNPDPSFNSHRSAPLQALEVDSPRPDKTPYYDPRELGGSLLNVRIGPHSTQFLAKPIFPHTELIQPSDDLEEPVGRW